MRRLDRADLANGVLTASAGNMAQGVGWVAHAYGVPFTSVVPEHAPEAKLSAIKRLGGAIVKVPFDRWWQALEENRFDGVPGVFLHPVQDPHVMAGNGTIALEILEDLPDPDVVLVPFGGGGLTCGIATVLRALSPRTRIIPVEPASAAPLRASLFAQEPREVDYQLSFVDGAGGRGVLPAMWPVVSSLVSESLAPELGDVARAVRLLAERAHVVSEGAGALALAAALSGLRAEPGTRVVCVVSGGNIDIAKFAEILHWE
jgi:threonine dehydratase